MDPRAHFVIPSLTGGWVEIAALRDRPRSLAEQYGYEPESDLDRAVREDDFVCTITVHSPERTLASPFAWSPEQQRRLLFFLAAIDRMTFRFPQESSLTDATGRFGIDAFVGRNDRLPRDELYVRFSVWTTSVLREASAAAELVFQKNALSSIAASCCSILPALGADDWRAAWN